MIEEQIKQRRILLMYITKISGHRQATLAIQQCLHEVCPQTIAPMINAFGYIYPRMEKIVHKAYMSVIKRTPGVWDYLYDNPKIFKQSQVIKKFLHKKSFERLDRLFAKYHPDTVVCTQAFPCGLVAAYKEERKLKVNCIGVLTDFAPHSYWIHQGVDYYVVPSKEAKERFMTQNVPEENIKVYGIPIRTKFALRLDKNVLAQKMGLDPQLPTILIMGGGQGLGPIKSIVQSLLKIKMPSQILVLTGTNKKMYESLKKYEETSKKKILVFGYIKNVDELMELASLIITKPGGMTTAESLSKGLPMLIVDPIPGQEMRNTDFLIKNGIAVRVDENDDIVEEVEVLLKSPLRLAAMSNAAYGHAKPNATIDIINLILNNRQEKTPLNFEETFSAR